MERLRGGWFLPPADLAVREVCSETGLLPGPECARRLREILPREPDRCARASEGFRLESPRPRDRFALDPETPRSSRFLIFRARASRDATVEWRVRNELIAVTRETHEVAWPAFAGRFDLRVRCGSEEIVRTFEVR
jgi:hypothetical protein